MYHFCCLECRNFEAQYFKTTQNADGISYSQDQYTFVFYCHYCNVSFYGLLLFSKAVEDNLGWQNPLKMLLVCFLINYIVNQITDEHIKPIKNVFGSI